MTDLTEIDDRIERVRAGFTSGTLRSIDARVSLLHALRRFLVDEEPGLTAALTADLGKSAIEAYVTEIGFVIGEVDHALDHLGDWTRPRKVRLPLRLQPGSARVVAEPLGTVLVIAPWNYPLHLLLAPLVPAIAAGNTVVLKPSELAPATAAFVDEHLGRYVDGAAVQVVTGGVTETTALLERPWDHIFYTGNGEVGRIVMRAAAEHLTPVTLELGGKSPTIVTPSADLTVAARRIAWGKFVNAGQTCVAPDYVLVERGVEPALVDALGRAIRDMFGDDPAASADFGRIVNERHHARLVGLLDGGGFDRIVAGGDHDATRRYFAPTILVGARPDAPIMSQEIFGPILPVIGYDTLDDAIAFVADRPKPLALYVFSGDDDVVDHLVASTSAGGVCVNHTLLHLAVPDLPFGGVGASGMGAYHGEDGFRVFSHAKPVMRRRTFPDPTIAYPPYTRVKQRLLRRLF